MLVGGFALDDGTLFRAAAIGGGILVVAGSIGNVLLTVLLNLLNELTGRPAPHDHPRAGAPAHGRPGAGVRRRRPPAGPRAAARVRRARRRSDRVSPLSGAIAQSVRAHP